MVKRKTFWDTLDEIEGIAKGSSYKNLKKERKRQGYDNEKELQDDDMINFEESAEQLEKFGELI